MMVKQNISEDCCFICKDGGLLLVCDHKHCCKTYHPECVGQDPSQLENNPWICSWHSCFICHKTSKFKCFCCPHSLCCACLNDAEFVTVKGEKGFCNDCMKLASLIEDDRDEDSDGGMVDFSDKETYEYLFKEYWEKVKLNENLCPEIVQKAGVFLKKGRHLSLFGKRSLEDKDWLISDIEYSGKKRGKVNRMKNSRKTEFIGWGSKTLLNFLTSLGKEVDKPISQSVVYDIVMDYVRENKLDVGKRKKITCDDRLRPLFRRKVVNRFRILGYLDSHFFENQMSEEENLCSSDDESPLGTCRKSKSKWKQNTSELKSFNKKALEMYKNSYASIVMENVKLLYLKRSLVVKLLGNPETFADKMVGSYVRVKPDPNDSSVTKKTYQLMQVTGVDKIPEPYKVHGVTTDIVLRVLHAADMVKDIPISMISDDDLLQEECENLRQRMNDGLLERPRVGLLEKKAQSLHEDITNHWIERELVKLDNLIDRANIRGWRRMFNEHMESKELLESQEERCRMLKELPKVIPDTEIGCHGTACQSEDAEGANEGKKSSSDEMAEGEAEGSGAMSAQKPRKRGRPKGQNAVLALVEAKGERNLSKEKDELIEGNVIVDHQAIGTAGHEETNMPSEKDERNIINLDDSDEGETVEEKKQTSVWLYKDPHGIIQGPFPLSYLRSWSEQGFFDRSFKVWQSGQDPSDAVLLTVVLSSA